MIKAPYNFVPLADKVFYPDWAEQVSQDIPFEDGEDGIIELTIENVSPLFIRNGGQDQEMSSHVIMPNGEKKYFIPGTSLKGCFRSVMEIMSFAKMQQYDKDSFGIPREFDTKKTDGKYYTKFMKNVSCGWLQQVGDDYYVSECVKGVEVVSHEDLKTAFKDFTTGRNHHSAQEKQESLSETELYPLYEKESVNYRVVCTGHFDEEKKFHEYLFSEDQYSPVLVDKKVIAAFESIHKNTEYYGGKNGKGGYLKPKLHHGERIPVFFTKDKGAITAVGITRMFRYPYPINVEKAVDNCYTEAVDYDKHDLPEVIFGYTGKEEKTLKGRVTISHALCDSTISDTALITQRGVLGSPSSSYYPLYVKQDAKNHEYISYKEKTAKIAGRKRYRVHRSNIGMALSAGNGNENVLTRIKLLPAGNIFHAKIILHNMRPAEIGALISAITFNMTEGTYHNIGMAKAFGYGKIKCSLQLKNLNKTKEEYIRSFEMLLAENEFDLTKNPSWEQLVSIASDTHEDVDMQFMELKEYSNMKKNTNFSVLEEAFKKPTLLSDIIELRNAKNAKEQRRREEEQRIYEEKEREKAAQALAAERKADIDKACQLIEQSKGLINAQLMAEAKSLLLLAQGIYTRYDENMDELDSLLASCVITKVNSLATLNEKNANGGYKVSDFKNATNRIGQWLKKNKKSELPIEEKNNVLECFKRLKANPDKKDAKELAKPNSKLLADICKYITKEEFEAL